MLNTNFFAVWPKFLWRLYTRERDLLHHPSEETLSTRVVSCSCAHKHMAEEPVVAAWWEPQQVPQ